MADVQELGISVDSSGVEKATTSLENMAKSGGKAEASATQLEGAMLRANLKAEAIGKSIGAVVTGVFRLSESFVKLGLDVGRYQDMADVTAADPAGLASMRTAADVAGFSMENIVSMMQRMQAQLSRTEDGTKGAGRALQELGIEVEQFKRLSPDQQVKMIAEQMNKYADSNEKVAIAQALIGRGGAQSLAFLKELGSQTEKNNGLTNEQIAAADDLSDSMARDISTIRQLVEILAVGTLPALSAVVGGFHDYIEEMNDARDSADRLGANKGVETFATGSARVLASALDGVEYFIRGLRIGGATIGAVGAEASLAAEAVGNAWSVLRGKMDFAEMLAANAAIGRMIASTREELGGDISKIANGDTIGDKIRKQLEDLKNMKSAAAGAGSAAPALNALAGSGDRVKKAVDPAADALKKLRQELETYSLGEYEKRLFEFGNLKGSAAIVEDFSDALQRLIELKNKAVQAEKSAKEKVATETTALGLASDFEQKQRDEMAPIQEDRPIASTIGNIAGQIAATPFPIAVPHLPYRRK